MRKLRPFLALFGGLALAAVIACGGDKAGGDSGTGSASGAAAAPLDLSATANSLASLKSFRYDLAIKLDIPVPTGGSDDDAFGATLGGTLFGALGDIKAEGSVVAPDKTEMKFNMAGQQIPYVQIGMDAWVKFGSSWQKTTADSGMDFGSPMDLVGDFLPQEALDGAKISQETVNGVKTTRYSFDKKAIEKMAAMGEDPAGLEELTDAKLDIWLNAEKIPVKILMDFAGTDETGQKTAIKMEMNIKDINSTSIQIKPPI